MGQRGIEDYLRVIYELYDGKKGCKSVDIANKLRVSKASVSEMLKKLVSKGYIEFRPYSKIKLTKKGKQKAERFYDKHYIIKKFIQKLLKYDEEKAYEIAHQLEHAFPKDALITLNNIVKGETRIENKIKDLSYIG